jgi:ferredoxin-NADP reductase/MOSC domain-containing protein YiiM
MRLVSINVARPRTVRWRGQDVNTSIYKQPVEGRRMARRLNLDGDGQADLLAHGGEHRAVYVYQRESYRHWERELGRTFDGFGRFGENFTVDGMADAEVCIGDRYRIGEAVFEVTQPRVTCFKVGMATEEPRMPALLVGHGRPGFYLRVIAEGEVGAGDAIELVEPGSDMSVCDVSALLYLPGDRSPDTLERAIAIPALSEGWRGSFQAMLDQARDAIATGNAGLGKATAPPAWTGFRPFRVAEVRAESRDVASFVLAPQDGKPLAPHEPGQFLTLRLRRAGDDRPVLRSYSLSAPADAGRLRISVKREPDGVASAHLHARVSPGDVLEIGAPRGGFTLDPEGERPIVLASAGVGVTPVLAMLAALAQARSEREVWWLHGARCGAEHALAAEARAFVATLPGARAHVRYSRPSGDDVLGRDYHGAGRLEPQVLADLGVPLDADYYLCGPAGFMAALSAGLVAAGAAPERLHSESFGPAVATGPRTPPHAPPGPAGDGPLVSFARTGLTVAWDARFATLLELAEACDVPADWSCRTGVCHRCEVGLVEGAVRYEPEPLDPPADGGVLVCCSAPARPVVLDL